MPATPNLHVADQSIVAGAALSSGLIRFRRRFVGHLRDRRDQILWQAHTAQHASTAEVQMTALEELRHLLHQIAGTAGFVGYGPLGRAAKRCEQLILAHRPFSAEKQKGVWVRLNAELGALDRYCRQVLREVSAPAEAS